MSIAQRSVRTCYESMGISLYMLLNLPCFSEDNPDEGEEVRNSREPIPFEAVFPYHEYEFGHEDKFGFRGYIYDIDSGGNIAVLKVSTASK